MSNWKDNFKKLVNDVVYENTDKNGNSESPSKNKSSVTKFPENNNVDPTKAFNTIAPTYEPAPTNNPFLESIIDMYQKGFEGLNMPGYDFFEFAQAVKHGGPDNPQAYQMAFSMGKGMLPSVNKEKLVSDADFYITEINKVYQELVTKGNARKTEISTQKTTEAQNLANELELLKQQQEAILNQITEAVNKLNAIDTKYTPQLTEAENKLTANDFAKNKIVSEIEKVKQGIIANLK